MYFFKKNEFLHGKKSSTCCNVVMNRIEQCCAAHIVQGCQQWLTTLLHAIQPQQYCSMLLTTVNNVGSTTLLNPAELQAHDFLPCIRLPTLFLHSGSKFPCCSCDLKPPVHTDF